MDGYCDETTKTIVVDEMKPDDHSKLNLKEYQNKVTRHELIHAFLFESGLAESSPWARNEEMVDWIASQFPKSVLAILISYSVPNTFAFIT